jgi:NitT/TauT family transport system substrate-binding protein
VRRGLFAFREEMIVRKVVAGLAVLALVSTGCAGASRAQGSSDVLRLGLFPNLTHAPGYVALEDGILDERLAPARVDVTYFNSGTDAGNALLAGSIDATYIGPGPAVGLFLQSSGGVAIVSGATSGGASLVVRTGSGIRQASDLRGKKVAVPGYGNTQDVALRTWLHEHGLEANDEGGDVSVAAVDNPELVGLFRADRLDAAWEPEPWPSLLVAQGLAEPLVDEADLWPDGTFATTVLLVRTAYLEAHGDIVRGLVEANVDALRTIQDDPETAKAAAQAGLVEAGAPPLDQAVVDAAWGRLTFSWDPAAPSVVEGAEHAFALGYLEERPGDLGALFRLGQLNGVLTDLGLEEVSA